MCHTRHLWARSKTLCLEEHQFTRLWWRFTTTLSLKICHASAFLCSSSRYCLSSSAANHHVQGHQTILQPAHDLQPKNWSDCLLHLSHDQESTWKQLHVKLMSFPASRKKKQVLSRKLIEIWLSTSADVWPSRCHRRFTEGSDSVFHVWHHCFECLYRGGVDSGEFLQTGRDFLHLHEMRTEGVLYLAGNRFHFQFQAFFLRKERFH